MIRVLLADDQELMRLGFSMVLGSKDGIEVVGEATDGAEAVRKVGELHPDVVLMDVRMPGVDGIAATKQIVAQYPDTKLIVLTTYDLDDYAFAGLRAGASGFLVKDVPPDQLVAAIRAVASGDAAISPRITKRMLELFGDELPRESSGGLADGGADSAKSGPLSVLTPRELDVLKLIAQGLTNAEIAEELFISETTVKTHVGNIFAKLNLRDRVQAVIFAYQHGLV
jgi:DNA-binding NarL/FixJ family response regulator